MATSYIALLRGINVGGHKKVPMAELKRFAEDLGFQNPQTYIQSGNLVFKHKADQGKIEITLEKAIAQHFGFAVDIIVRSATEWDKICAKFPFATAAKTRAHLVMLGLAKNKIAAGAEAKILPYAKNGEKIKIIGNALWIDFAQSVGKSKITPQNLDRALGSPVTMRNWRTVLQLQEMCKNPAEP